MKKYSVMALDFCKIIKKKNRISFGADFLFSFFYNKTKTRILLIFLYADPESGVRRKRYKWGSDPRSDVGWVKSRTRRPGAGIRIQDPESGYRDPDPRSVALIQVPQSWYAKKKTIIDDPFCWDRGM